MDPTSLAVLIKSFQDMAKSNQELVAAVQSGTAQQLHRQTPMTGDAETTRSNDMMGAVALTGIKVPLTLGDSAEERLINFHEWKDEVMDKLTVAGISDQQRRTTIALMWGGKEIKEYAIEKAGVVMHGNGTTHTDAWNDAITKIETKMEEGINEAFAMLKFRQNEQGQRSINTWYKQLKSTVKTLRLQQCTCGHRYSEERAIRDVIVALTADSKLRKDALSKDLSLTELLKAGETNELARTRAATVEQKHVNKLNMTDDRLTEDEANYMIAKLKRAGKYSTKYDKADKANACDRCVKTPRSRPHTSDTCYFKDQECRVCKQTGHMGGSKRCKAKPIHKVVITETDYNDSSNWDGSDTDSETEGTSPKSTEIAIRQVGKRNVVRVQVGDVYTDMYADSGADVSIVPANWYQKGMGTLRPTKAVLTPYGGASESIPVEAKFRTIITTQKGAKTDKWVYVVNSKHPIQPLLGDDAASELGFLLFRPEGREPTKEELEEKEIQKVSMNVQIGSGTMPDSADVPEITKEEVQDCWAMIRSPKYASIFDPKRIGTMKKRAPITFHRNEEKRIISQPYRPIPPQFREELSKHLQFLRENNKIVDVDPNTETVESFSNVVISRKPSGSLRMNLDARPINAALCDIVSPHMTTPEDVRHEITGATRFSEFDMNHGYNQSTLGEESSKKYGVFQTHEGFHRFIGLYFGHKQSSQAFDADVKTTLRGLIQTKSVADNIMVHGRTADEHKKGLIDFLDRCLAEGITLAMHKTTICQHEILWFGYLFGKDGVRPDPAKVQKLKEKGVPETQEEVRSFLQAAQFNARFMWDTDSAYSHITQPLRKLLGKNVVFEWSPEQQSSYDEIINALESAGALYPYNPSLEITHVADAQPTGIASSVYMVTEDGEEMWWPLDHISRSLTPTESGYPQIDRESLAQSWGMRQQRYYLLGRKFNTYCDHQPLLPFYNGTKRATPRVEKHILSIQDLDYKMVHMPGKDNPTDWNSRHPEPIEEWSSNLHEKHDVDNGEEIRLNRVVAVQKLSKILDDAGITGEERVAEEKIEEVGLLDEDYNTTRKLIQEGKSKKVKGKYKRIAGELSTVGDLMVRDRMIVVPKGQDGSLRTKILDAAHEGHPGMSQLKSKLRGSVYWPGITKEVEERFRSCLACQTTTEGKHHADKLHPSEPPERAWTKVGADHWGPLPDGSGRHILVVQDYLTKYPEAVLVQHTAGKDNIRALEEIFGRHGYPETIVTDNGPPWNGAESHEMKQYLKWAGVEHSPTQSADDPEANGLTERFMQTIRKSWATAYVEDRDPLAALNTTLKSYRNTQHSVTKRKPAVWLFGRTIRTRLPQLQTQCEDAESAAAKERMRERGALEKQRHDTKAREESIQVGMQVLLKNRKKKKGMPKYDPNPFTVAEVVGRQAVLQRGSTTLRRETQKFKRYYPKMKGQSTHRWDDEWEEGQRAINQGKQTVTPSANPQTPVPNSSADEEEAETRQNTPLTTANNTPQPTDRNDRTDTETETAAPPRRGTRNRRAPERLGSWE